jgi:hypothetical protein
LRRNKGLKPAIVTTEKGDIVIGAFEGENVWDDMIHMLNNMYLDYSIIYINV